MKIAVFRINSRTLESDRTEELNSIQVGFCGTET